MQAYLAWDGEKQLVLLAEDEFEPLEIVALGEGVDEKSLSRFLLAVRAWRGQQVIRFGPSTKVWDLFVHDGAKGYWRLELESSPLKKSEIAAQPVPGATLIDADGETRDILALKPGETIAVKPGTRFNPTKETPCQFEVLDAGDAKALEEEKSVRKYDLRGKKLKGTWFFRAEDESKPEAFWLMSKSGGPETKAHWVTLRDGRRIQVKDSAAGLSSARSSFKPRYEAASERARREQDGKIPADIMQEYHELEDRIHLWAKEEARERGIKPPYGWQVGVGVFRLNETGIQQLYPKVAKEVIEMLKPIYAPAVSKKGRWVTIRGKPIYIEKPRGEQQQPGGLYRPMKREDLPDRIFHGTSATNVESILENGLKPEPRGQSAMPLVSTSPHLDSAQGWSGGGDVIEIEVDKLPKGRVWSSEIFDEIAFEKPVPQQAIKRVWRSEWQPTAEVKPDWVALRGDADWTLVMMPEEVARKNLREEKKGEGV